MKKVVKVNTYKKTFLTCFYFFCFHIFSQENHFQYSFKNLSVNDGLSQNSVVSITQDSIGYMWFATQDGLNRYDGKEFIIYDKQFEDVTRSTYSKLGKTYVDKKRNIWIVSNSGRLEKLEKRNKLFNQVKLKNKISVVFQSDNLDYYLGTYGNGLLKIDYKSKDTLQVFNSINSKCTIYDFLETNSSIYTATSLGVFKIGKKGYNAISFKDNITSEFSSLAKTRDDIIWLGSYGKGLFYKEKNIFKQFTGYNDFQFPTDLNIQDLLVDSKNNLWVATYGNGVYLINTLNKSIKNFRANKKNPFAIHYDDILSIYEDYTGTIWFGTDGSGLSYYDEHLTKFNTLKGNQLPASINVDVIRAISVTHDNKIWLGTSGKGLTKIDFSNGKHKTYTSANSKINNNRVMSLLEDNNKLWIGYQDGGLNLLETTQKIINYPDLQGITIWYIAKKNNHQIWLCTRNNGLLLFDDKKGIVASYNTNNSSLPSNNIRVITYGKQNELWIGTDSDGLFKLDISNNKINKVFKINDKIKSLYFDNKNLWVGTNGNGLKLFYPNTEEIINFTTKDGLSNNVIYGILPDNNNNLWLSSNKGISKLSFKNNNFNIENYNNYDGLQSLEFNTGAYYKDKNGYLYFGGLEGLNWFNPNDISLNEVIPKTVLSKVEVFGKEVPITPNTKYKSNQNTLTFTFSALHFSLPKRNQYKYKLINNDEKWIESGNNNVAHYTNLPPNDYEFQVISCNYDGFCNEKPLTYKFTILKPWYATNIAYVIYLLILLSILYIVYRYFNFRWKIKTKLQLKQAETERVKKLSAFKEKLYSNISHEFRTPLTVIQGLSNKLEQQLTNYSDIENVQIIHKNASLLNEQLKQILAISSLEKSKLTTQNINDDIMVFIKSLVNLFSSYAISKEQHIQFVSQEKNILMDFDPEKLQSILQNLISNALKFNKKDGEITVSAKKSATNLLLKVIDTGIGIEADNLTKVFDRFYTSSSETNTQGTGIGLAYVKELVELANGTIDVESKINVGTTFTITLPITQNAKRPQEKIKPKLPFVYREKNKVIIQKTEISTHKKKTILTIEDNKDIQLYYKQLLNDTYKVIQAFNGKEAQELLKQKEIDLILCDLAMPEMDGFQFSKHLKQNSELSHIPLIIISANVTTEAKTKGYQLGIDAYLTKPFKEKELLSLMDNLFKKQMQKASYFSNLLELKKVNKEHEIRTIEVNFIKKLQEFALENTIYSTEELAQKMAMSRSKLNQKVNTLTEMSVANYIKHIKIEKAKELLKTTPLQVNEIAFQLGYQDASLFSKVFKKVTGQSPSSYKDSL